MPNTSTGWLSKPRPTTDSSSRGHPKFSGEQNASEDETAITSNINDERRDSSLDVSRTVVDKGVSIDDEFDHMFEEEPFSFTEALRRDGTQKDSEKTSKCDIKQDNDTIQNSVTDFSSDDYFDHNPDELDYISTLRGEASSYGKNRSQEAEIINVPHSSSSLNKMKKNTQVHESTLKEMFSYKPREREGVQFSESDLETEKNDSEIEKNASGNKYEQILLRKRELKGSGSGWIDSRKMKKKLRHAFSK